MEAYDDGFYLLPENFLAEIILKTSVKDACRSSSVSVGFKSASESDSVWEKFLPCDYQEIISNSDTPLNFSTKKELFFLLCDSNILINGGTLSFWICKASGKKCYMLRARDLSIAWKDNPMYWTWKSIPQSRFCEVAELRSICWLEIKGKIRTKLLSPKTTYVAYLVYKVNGNYFGLETASKSSVKYIGAVEDENADECDGVHLMPLPIQSMDNNMQVLRAQRLTDDARVPEERRDGWMEIYLGKFYNDQGEGEIEMKLFETNTLNWKNGLILEGIEVRPM